MGCGTSLAKLFLFVFNAVFWLGGAAVLGLGIWIRVDPKALNYLKVATVDSNDLTVNTSAYVLIGVGAFIFITGFCGCCGAIRENVCMLTTYIVILVIVILLQVVAGILAAVFKGKIGDELDRSMKKTVQERYGPNDTTGITKSWDYVQVFFECCGADNATDWYASKYYKAHKIIPPSCCVLKEKNADNPEPKNPEKCHKMMDTKYYHQKGCYPGLLEWVNSKAGILIGVAIGLAAIQILGLAFACCLCRSIKEHDYHQV